MKKIIVVYGDSNTGKTTVINLVHDKLLSLGAGVINPKVVLNNSCDFEAVLSCGKKTIAFYSFGDYRSYVSEHVEKIQRM